ncbi:MAG: hypothetical protein LUF90_03315 [Rikenellaceae bacterium]|nr:hypothetical protein [Rikenellaceae bacterium]
MIENQTIIDRVNVFIKSKNIRKAQFEKMCGLSNGYLNSVKKKIGSKKLEDILSVFPELNKDWLLTGEGEMCSEKRKNRDEPDMKDFSAILDSYTKIASAMEKIADSSYNVSEANKILAHSNSELVTKLAQLMDEINELKESRIKNLPPQKGALASDNSGEYKTK